VGALEALGWNAVLLVACTSFGVGFGLALVFPAAALLVLGWRGVTRAARLVLLALPAAATLLWLGVHALYGRLYQPEVGGTASFILGAYPALRAVPWMLLELLGVGVTALLHPFGDTF